MAVPDTNMLLYLHACSKALPRVEMLLDDQSRRFRTEVVGSIGKIDEVNGELGRHVERMRNERGQSSADMKELYSRIAVLEDQLSSEQSSFAERVEKCDEEHERARVAMVARMAGLRVEQEEAQQWERDAKKHKEALANTLQKLEAMKAQHEQNIATINASHEDRKRKFRDVVVRKLRHTRDVMTAVGGGDGDVYRDIVGVLQQQGLGGAVVPGKGTSTAARLTEQLSREVTAFERETQATSHVVAAFEAKKVESLEVLRSERERNGRLVSKNASHTQSLKTLQLKLEQLKAVRQTSDLRRSNLADERTAALRAALEAERGVRYQLEEDLEEKQGELERLVQERSRAEEALAEQIAKDVATMELFEELLRGAEDEAAHSNNSDTARGRLGADDRPLIKATEPIRALQLHTQGDVARLLSTAMQCLVSVLPQPPTTFNAFK